MGGGGVKSVYRNKDKKTQIKQRIGFKVIWQCAVGGNCIQDLVSALCPRLICLCALFCRESVYKVPLDEGQESRKSDNLFQEKGV